MIEERYLIVNADDFGISSGVNRGIIAAHTDGIVSSASLMVRWPAAEEAATLSRDYPNLNLGLHVDLGEWVYERGAWSARYEIVPTHDAAAVDDEIARQLATFHRLTGKEPTHLDSHQHVHLNEPVRSILAARARALGIPLRHCTPGIRFCGDFYGQTGKGLSLPDQISVDALLHILEKLPPGVTELGCHPGDARDLDSPYRDERALEVKALCDPRVRAALAANKITLCSFTELVQIQPRQVNSLAPTPVPQ